MRIKTGEVETGEVTGNKQGVGNDSRMRMGMEGTFLVYEVSLPSPFFYHTAPHARRAFRCRPTDWGTPGAPAWVRRQTSLSAGKEKTKKYPDTFSLCVGPCVRLVPVSRALSLGRASTIIPYVVDEASVQLQIIQ